jgi:general stress protein CsbA
MLMHEFLCPWILLLNEDPIFLFLFFCCVKDTSVSEIVLKAMGRAINKTVLLAEILKVSYTSSLYFIFLSLCRLKASYSLPIVYLSTQRKEEGLYQDITINSVDITDTWEPLEEGLLP